MLRKLTVSTLGAWGHSCPHGLKQIAVRMPEHLFKELKARSIKEGLSMQAKLLDYIQVGLEVDRDWDEDEPDRTFAPGQ